MRADINRGRAAVGESGGRSGKGAYLVRHEVQRRNERVRDIGIVLEADLAVSRVCANESILGFSWMGI